MADLLAREDPSFSFPEASRLFRYAHSRSPRLRLQLWWRYVSDRDTPARARRLGLLARDLREQLNAGCRVAVNYFERWNTSRDLARVPPFLEKALHRTTPALVVQPRSEQDIARVLVFCRSRGLAVFPRGSGSFAFGGAVPTRYGIVLDLSPMMAVLEVDPQGHTVRVQPGARWADRYWAARGGSCLDYCAESFMAGEQTGGGFVIINGLTFDERGEVIGLELKYPGNNLFSLASGGACYLNDPYHTVTENQLNGGEFLAFRREDWGTILPYLQENGQLFGISIRQDLLMVDGVLKWPEEVFRKIIASRETHELDWTSLD